MNLAKALVGTEGTCATIPSATVDLVSRHARAGAGRARLPGRLPRRRPRGWPCSEQRSPTIEGMDAG
ncbi:hypothetical protein HBB16_06140 [Pseudonocardia sp. MCCB 268]|nr:hypothetical protein [Pseudonocardia cytotoxica]